ncbi:hypothetical protein [Sphingosinicella sp. CPCC 101087]|uniref:hypothetical protein n=1 Tax=Sphingosinicella sp. CPCC 101087 TaxID=2497754 RepID=UPI00101BF3F4|nr:hypothetical protein [Sphingosinicella sp. CPCC 101087]
MNSQADLWLEALAMLAVIVAIPFYMGMVHLGIVEVLAYVAVGALSMSVGEALQSRGFTALRLDDLLYDIGLWMVATATLGGAAYAAALILI